MKAVLIGSAVYKDNPQDIDLIADREFAESFDNPTKEKETDLFYWYLFDIDGKIVEVSIPKKGTAYDLVLSMDFPHRNVLGRDVSVASLEVLAALKKAHLILPHKWQKHIEEYKTIKDMLGVSVFKSSDFGVRDLYRLHRRESKSKSKAHPKLNVDKNNFFEEAEFKIFDHDTIHKAVALGSEPAYTLMQDGEVWVSRKKWTKLSEYDKMRCLMEEASVLALERSIIPALFLGRAFNGRDWAYRYALEKVCTTITSGWFRDFSIEHYHEALDKQPDYVGLFFEGVKSGVVKILKPEVVFKPRNMTEEAIN